MDPNACLAEIREILRSREPYASRLDGRTSDRLAELVESLDGWIDNGGFLPADWERK